MPCIPAPHPQDEPLPHHPSVPLAGVPPGRANEEEDDDDADMPYPHRLAAMSARSGSASSSRTGSAAGGGSAVINLRGSRPNSAAIAQEIEGFEDDFMVGGHA